MTLEPYQKREKGTHARGETSGMSKLKDFQVYEIRRLYTLEGLKIKDIAKKFSVNETTISSIVKNKTWKHLL